MPEIASGTIGASPGRKVALAGVWIFTLSSAFPIIASVVPVGRFPKWMGWLDVLLASALIVCAAIVDRRARSHLSQEVRQTTYRAYRVLINVPIALLCGFFMFGDRITWPVLLVGLAWRFWLLCYVLPSGIAAWSRPGPNSGMR
jgi:ABC-type xylose transport system permease subunit